VPVVTPTELVKPPKLSVIRFNAWASRSAAFLDEWFWGGVVLLVSFVTLGFAWVSRAIDDFVINLGFDKVCGGCDIAGHN